MENKLIKVKKYIYRSAVGIENKIKYGKNAPLFGELIYINPKEHQTYFPATRRSVSGKVQGGDWDLEPRDAIENIPRYRFCTMRWEKNIPWVDTGVYEYMLREIERKGSVDGCYNLDDIIIRYEKLDELFEHIKKTRKLKTQKELNSSAFNEEGGILFHIDRDNRLIFGAGGMHRFSMAKILRLERIPAQVGLLHPEALNCWREHKKI